MGRDYKKIKAWQLADRFVVDVYEKSKGFPKEEVYGITSQLRRAAVSVPLNIVEGAARNSQKEYLQFLYIAKGSLAEVEYILNLSQRLNYITEGEYKQLDGLLLETIKTLSGLTKAVKSNID